MAFIHLQSAAGGHQFSAQQRKLPPHTGLSALGKSSEQECAALSPSP